MSIENTLERIADALETLVARGAIQPPVDLVPEKVPAKAKPAKVEPKPAPSPEPVDVDVDVDDGSTGEPLNIDAIKNKCMLYAQPDKGGVQAMKEVFVEVGSTGGNWSGVPADNYAALNARLDQLLGG